MSLAPGQRLGPYEVMAPLGAGGMGEVYRARDPRLHREVALKVLPEEPAGDPDRRARFEQEARAASALNHPNIVTIHDIGSESGRSYIAMELVDGRSLREVAAAGPLPARKLLEIGAQIAEGLARAHTAGIVHRDLKPENVMVGKDGLVKVLDFGLAKVRALPAQGGTNAPTISAAATEPGAVLGTVGYMSPEQAAGRPADYRSDQFSLGAILYELATGARAFHKANAIDTLSAILHDDPEPMGARGVKPPVPLRWIVDRCLAKEPEERFASTADLARDLKAVRDHLSELTSSAPMAGVTPPRRRSWPRIGLAAVAVAAIASGAYLAGARLAERPPPSFKRVTFRRGQVWSARFAPDGQTVVYSAVWEGQPARVYTSRLGSPEATELPLPDAHILSLSPSSEMALLLRARFDQASFLGLGTLARMPLGGGAPREIASDVSWADWTADGKDLAIVRDAAGKAHLEMPVGKVLLETNGWLGQPRISPDGDRIAVALHDLRFDDAGAVVLFDRTGKKTELTSGWTTLQGVSWDRAGDRVFFAGARSGAARALHSVSLAGEVRLLANPPGTLTLQDVDAQGRALVSVSSLRVGIFAMLPGATRERDLSWFDYSILRDMSDDGSQVLFDESGDGGGAGYSVYVRDTDGSPAVRLGEGTARALSPDGRWALTLTKNPPRQVVLLPVGAGAPRTLTSPPRDHGWARWLPDGNGVVFIAWEPGHAARLYRQGLDETAARPFTPEGVTDLYPVSPDGRSVLARWSDGSFALSPLDGGERQPVPGIGGSDFPVRFTADGKALYVHRRAMKPSRLVRLDPETGREELLREIDAPDQAGRFAIMRMSADGSSYAYSYGMRLSELYVVEGLR